MIDSKLAQAKRTVQVWADLSKGQAGFKWQFDMLVKTSDQDAATALAVWWDAHPANPNPVR